MSKINLREAWRRLEESHADAIQEGIDSFIASKKVKNNSGQAKKQALQSPNLKTDSAKREIET